MSTPASWNVGDTASLSKQVSADDIDRFAELVLDDNPVHVDDEYARTTSFGARIAHGPYLIGIVGAVLATRLPGPGTVALELTTRFRAPAYVGDTVTASVTVADVPRPDRYRLDIAVTNQDGTTLITGSGLVQVGIGVPAPT